MRGSRPLAPAEVADVADSFGGRFALRDRALFVLGVRSGFRVSELLSLRVRDVSRGGRIVDRVAVARRSMKRKTRGRIVVLHPEAREALRAWLEVLPRWAVVASTEGVPGDWPLFVSRKRRGNGGPLAAPPRPISRSQAHRVLQMAYEVNELDGRLGTHAMRKTFATTVHEALGRDINRTREALGQSNIVSTIAYLPVHQAEIDQAVLSAGGSGGSGAVRGVAPGDPLDRIERLVRLREGGDLSAAEFAVLKTRLLAG